MRTPIIIAAAIAVCSLIAGAKDEWAHQIALKRGAPLEHRLREFQSRTIYYQDSTTGLCFQYFEVDVHPLLNLIPQTTYVPCEKIPPTRLKREAP